MEHTLSHPPSLTSDRRPLDPALPARLRARIERDFESRWHGLWGGRSLLHGRVPGADAVRLDGNDYLGVTGHPEVVAAQVEATRQAAGFVVQSSVFLSQPHPARALEQSLAAWLGKDDGMLCQSGYAANIGLLQAIADPDTPVYLDSLAHMSLWEGAHAARAPAHAFRHNDAAHLDRTLARHGTGVVVVDAVYSTTGALCELEAIVDVCERHEAVLVVDESHSLGTHGPGGAGLCAARGLTSRVHFITASLAKAVAGRAGFYTSPHGLRNYLLSEGYPGIFSSCLLLPEVAGLRATVGVLQRAEDERARLHRSARWLRQALADLGYPVHQGTEQIIALEAGTEPATMVLRDELERQGVFGAVFCAPATSRNRAMVRLTLSAGLTQAELDHVVAVARDIAPRVRPWDWPMARRARMAGGPGQG